MGRLVAPLSDRKVKTAKPKEKIYRLSDGNGLVLEVKPNGTKVWRVRYTFNKKAKMYTIGEYPYVSLANARAETIEVKELLRKGIDPVEHRRLRFEKNRSLGPMAFKEITEEFLELKKSEWSKLHLEKQKRRIEIYIYPFLGFKQIGNITKADIVRVVKNVKKIVTPTTKNTEKIEVSKRVFYLISQVWRYALHNDYIDRDIPATIDISQIIPKALEGHFKAITNEEEIRRIFKLITEEFRGYKIVGFALEFLALTALRPGNVANLKWEWVDLDRKMIVFPPEAMKTKKEFRLPLTKRLLEILQEMQNISKERSQYVFCSPLEYAKPLSNNTLNQAHKRLGINDHNAHGWRSSFSTICYEKQREHGFGADVIEAQLHHQIGNSVVRAYMRSDFLEERRELMEWWGEFLNK